MSGIQAYRVRTEDTFLARLMLCDVLYRLHEDEDLVAQYQDLLRYREGPTMRVKLGLVYDRLGRVDEAIEQFELASAAELRDDGSHVDEAFLVESRRYLLRTLHRAGREQEALAAIERWHERAPGGKDKIALFLHARWLAAKGDYDGAIELGRQLATEYDDPRGGGLVSSFERARELRARVDAGEPTWKELEELSQLCYAFDDAQGSVDLLERAVVLAEDQLVRANLLQLLSESLEEMGDLPAALQKANEALELDVPASTRAAWKKRRDLLQAIA
jgi:tetratricopeptide (TPR) repeat protein